MTRNGTVLQFDSADGLGNIALDDGETVRFGLADCVDFRSTQPVRGLRVIVEDTRSGYLGVKRATRVRMLDESWDVLRPVWGLTEPRTIDCKLDGRVRCVPFDAAAFDRIGEARIHDADARAFTPRRSENRDVHPVAELLRHALAPEGRLAYSFARVDAEPPLGSTFVGGEFADLADEWPVKGKTPLKHVLQIGRADAQRLGIDQQLNVFATSGPPVVMASAGGARRHAASSRLSVVALGQPTEVVVYPASFLLRTTDPTVQSQLTSFDRAYVLSPDGVLQPPDLRWFAATGIVAQSWRTADGLPDPLVLGGLSWSELPERPTYRRLASLSLKAFPGLAKLLGLESRLTWRRWSVDWQPENQPTAIATAG